MKIDAYRADLDAIRAFVESHKSFCVAAHQSPDGDALASTLGLALGLRQLGKKALPYNQDRVPADLKFLPGAREMTSKMSGFEGFDGIFIVDCGDIERIRDGFARERKPPLVNLDHHVTNPRFGDYNLIIPEASSSGQVVYYLLKHLGVELTPEIAWNLYTTLVVDTGSFQYSNTTPETFRIAAELLGHGVRPEVITENLHYHVPLKKWKLFGRAVETLRLELGGRVATLDLTQAMLRGTGASFEDNEGFIDMVRQLDGTEIAILLKEHAPDKIKVSLRAKDRADVAAIAQAFGGGGHRNAAGCTIHAGLEEARKRLLSEVARELDSAGKT